MQLAYFGSFHLLHPCLSSVRCIRCSRLIAELVRIHVLAAILDC
jgi:hypothetical protein